MNRKMIALVMVVVIGVLAVSAFSWTTDHDSKHEGLTIYHQSERANYAGDQVAAAEDAMAYRWDAMAKFYAGDQVATVEDAMAKFYAGDQVASAEDAMAYHWDAMAKFYAGD